MGDYTYAQVIVYDCPEAERAACLAAIEDAFDENIDDRPTIDSRPGSADYSTPGRWVDVDTLVLGAVYGSPECPLDMHDTIANAIREAAPGSTFATWVDPKYEWSGELVMYAPDLGVFGASCDANGNATVTSDEVRRMMAESLAPDERRYGGRWPDAALREALNNALGIAWSDAIDAHRARIEDRAHPAPEGYEWVRCPLGAECTIEVDAGTEDATPGGQSAAQLAQGRHFHDATPIDATAAAVA